MKIWSQEHRQLKDVSAKVPFILNGKTDAIDKKIIAGEMEGLELTKPIGEMLTSDQSRKELIQKVVLDVEIGREAVVPLYGSIYDTLTDATFPQDISAKWEQYGQILFTRHYEGQEVQFGSLKAEEGPTVKILGYAAGWEFTKEMQIFNQAFTLEMLNKAIGEAHGALQNHLALYPIISATYANDNKTAYQGAATDAAWLRLYLTIAKGLDDASAKKRPATVLLVSGANKSLVEQALKGGQVGGTVYPAISGITDVVYYDGWEVTVAKKTTTYDGVNAAKAYLVRPKRGFKRLVKQDLLVQATMGDISTLTESQIVADSWEGIYAAVGNNVQELTIG